LKANKHSKYSPPSAQSLDTLDRYQKALAKADIAELENLLVNDIKLNADGGTKVQVVTGREVGKTATATLLIYVQQQVLGDKKFTFHFCNHQPAICFWDMEKLYNCQILQLNSAGLISEIYSIVDPE